MKIRGLVALVLTTAVATGFSTFASAGALSCESESGSITRTWTFNSAELCSHGPGNPNSSADIEALGGIFDLGAANWAKDEAITKDGDGSSLLNVSLLTGNWGDQAITATWTLAAGFWESFGKAVFTVHVGHGSEELSDFGAFFITPGQYSGTWSFTQTTLATLTTNTKKAKKENEGNEGNDENNGSGGLSNARLWTAGTGTIVENPREVPEPGILLLFATGLLGLGLGKNRKAKA